MERTETGGQKGYQQPRQPPTTPAPQRNEKGYPRPKGPPPTTTTTASPCGQGYLVAPLPPSSPGQGPAKGI